MQKIYLNDNWQLMGSELLAPLAVSVPGCVHTDLLSHGVISDPFWRDNNKENSWIELSDWTYSTVFDAPTGDNVAIVFDGLDTYADIYLNDECLGSVGNMFIPHTFPVSEILKPIGNRLEVRFRSPVREVEGRPTLPAAFTCERLHTRRLQCTYGWDWVDRFVTCGIFRPVYLTYSSGIEIDSLYVYTDSIDKYSAQICTELFFVNIGKGGLATVKIIAPDGTIVAKTQFYADRAKMIRRFDIPSPQLWFPNGYGSQPLYRICVSVADSVLEENFGIRTLKILQLPDVEGTEYYNQALASQSTDAGKLYSKNEGFTGFQVVVNGVKIFCRGGNWVPCEPFPSAETDDKISTLVTLARDMGANFLRVWGGGLFERRSFYDACDRCGILVAQDFLMACGSYPEKEEWFIKELSHEAEFAAKYLRNHPSLAWWHGDNENATLGSDTDVDYQGRESALGGIAPVLYEHDHSRTFLPSSPYGGKTYASLTVGTSHTTNYLGRIFDYFDKNNSSDYKEYLANFVSRFVSEEGTLGAISRPSMLKFMTEHDLISDTSEEMLIYHTKTNPPLKRHIFEYVSIIARKILGDFADGEDKYFKYKYIQYEWIRVALENARRTLGYCNGMIFWMFNDCWPAALGWALVDYYCLPKPSYYSFKRAAKPIIASVSERGGKYAVTVSNTSESDEPVCLTAYRLDLTDDFAVVDTYTATITAAAYTPTELILPWQAQDGELIVCDIGSEYTDRAHYKRGTLPVVPADDQLTIVSRTDTSITLAASSYIHAVELEGQYIFEDNYFSMLRGEIRTVSFKQWKNTDSSDFTVKAYTLSKE